MWIGHRHGRLPWGQTRFEIIWSPNSLDRIAWFFKYPCVLICKYGVRCGHNNRYSKLSVVKGKHDPSCTETINTHAHAHTSTEADINEHWYFLLWDYFIWKRLEHSVICSFGSYFIQRKSYFTSQSSQLWGLMSLFPAPPCYLVPALQNLLLNLNYNLCLWLKLK